MKNTSQSIKNFYPGPEFETLQNKRRTLLIWDTEGSPPSGDWTTVLWRSFGNSTDPSAVSIPKLVEEQADDLRSRYLAWVHEMGETLIKGKRIVDHLELRPGFSYWWMTSLAQKFNASGTSQIDNAIKSLVLERLVSDNTPTSILLVSGNDKIASVLQIFCKKLGLSFKWKHANPIVIPKPSAFRRIFRTLPSPLRALICFIWYLFRCFKFRLAKKESAQAVNGEITFVDIFVHLDAKAFTKGTFISNYWTTLVDKLLHSRVKTNWLHNYFPQEAIPNLVRAHELTNRFSKSTNELQTHILIESNMSISVFLKALKDYFRTCSSGYKVSEINRHFKPHGSAMDFWPLFKQEWIDSLRGQSAMVNCLRFCLYEKTFSALPYQRLGIYIQENQPWEMALIYAWKGAGHGKLVGTPHASVRFWDLRYFYDHRSYIRTGKNVLPTPDLVAVNGPVAKRHYLDCGYPELLVTEVEALRFLHLLNRKPTNAPIKSQVKALNVLICGDFLSSSNHKILSWIAIAALSLPPETNYVLKPHPACPVNLSDFPSLRLQITDAPLTELFGDCDVFFSNITTAAVDAYCSGIPVVQMLDGNTLNMSPLRGIKGVPYVTDPVELAETLHNVQHCERVMSEPYFCLDKEMPRWQKLLGMNSADARRTAVHE